MARLVTTLALALGLAGCGSEEQTTTAVSGAPKPPSAESPASPVTLTLYCGRSRSLVDALINDFEKAHDGITVERDYAKTPILALKIREQGRDAGGDLFWAQDATALAAVSKAGLLQPLDPAILALAAPAYRAADMWVATSGRARVLAYAPARVGQADLPASVFDLVDPKWKGRIGWAPTNASFQAFVTAMRKARGDDAARDWLTGMMRNEAQRYPKNTPIIKGLADDRIDLGLPNHYYLLRFRSTDADYPVAQRFFEAGDVGNLVNVAGIGILADSPHPEAAAQFVRFLLSETAQRYFAERSFEYPVVEAVPAHEMLNDLGAPGEFAPSVPLDDLQDLDGTLALLREVGLL
ncbi:MAG: iron ABC transporter substrate-binding protein [Phycisphaeraceae bacterium]|nr:iron ABC transporter substrate-binding protein [Phycisphaeraceae bacterium]